MRKLPEYETAPDYTETAYLTVLQTFARGIMNLFAKNYPAIFLFITKYS